MSDEIYPYEPRPVYGYSPSQSFSTGIIGFKGGGEQRRSYQAFPKYSYVLGYDQMTSAQLDMFWNFYRRHKGAGESFWYYDHKSYLFPEESNFVDQYIGYGDGVIDTFDIPGILSNIPTGVKYRWNFIDGAIPAELSGNDLAISVFAQRLRVDISNGAIDPKLVITNPVAALPSEYKKMQYRYRYASGDYSQQSNGEYVESFNTTLLESSLAGYLPAVAEPTGQWAVVNIDFVDNYDSGLAYTALTDVKIHEISGFQDNYVGDTVFEFDEIILADDFDKSLTIYHNGQAIVEGVDYNVVYGGGAGNADRIKYISAVPQVGTLVTCDFTGSLRVKSRFAEDNYDYAWFAASLFENGIELVGVLPNA